MVQAFCITKMSQTGWESCTLNNLGLAQALQHSYTLAKNDGYKRALAQAWLPHTEVLAGSFCSCFSILSLLFHTFYWWYNNTIVWPQSSFLEIKELILAPYWPFPFQIAGLCQVYRFFKIKWLVFDAESNHRTEPRLRPSLKVPTVALWQPSHHYHKTSMLTINLVTGKLNKIFNFYFYFIFF